MALEVAGSTPAGHPIDSSVTLESRRSASLIRVLAADLTGDYVCKRMVRITLSSKSIKSIDMLFSLAMVTAR